MKKPDKLKLLVTRLMLTLRELPMLLTKPVTRKLRKSREPLIKLMRLLRLMRRSQETPFPRLLMPELKSLMSLKQREKTTLIRLKEPQKTQLKKLLELQMLLRKMPRNLPAKF